MTVYRPLRCLRPLALTGLLAMALAGVSTGPADASSRVQRSPAAQLDVYRLKDLATSRWLETNYQGKLFTNSSLTGSGFQLWYRWGSTVKNVETGLCLDSDAQQSAYTKSCNNGNYQNWTRSNFLFRDNQTGYCLDSDAGGVAYTKGCNNGNYQNWNLESF